VGLHLGRPSTPHSSEPVATDIMTDSEPLLRRLENVQVSSLCDADKSLIPLPPLLVHLAGTRNIVGAASTVVAEDDHLSTFYAVTHAPRSSVLVVATNDAPGRKAVLGELFAFEARRRGVRGIVVDGFVRDLKGLQRVGLPVWARGTNPSSGTMRKLTHNTGAVVVFGQMVSDMDIVVADDDGVIIASAQQLQRAIDLAEQIEKQETVVIKGQEQNNIPLDRLTNAEEYIEGLFSGNEVPFQFRID
jgi:4-hydroxy-4-methyl-2-oxoglutarate aldolase